MRIPLVTLICLIAGSVLIDWYIWADIRRNSRHRLWPTLYGASSLICWIVLGVGLSLPRRGESSILPIMWILYSYLTLYIPKLLFIIFSLLGGLPRLWKKKSIKLGLYFGLPLGIFVFGTMWWGAVDGRQQIEVNSVKIESPKIPNSFDGYRIVQFSDAHVGTWGTDTTFVSKLVDSINSLNPNLILFTGDIVNRQTAEIKPFIRVLSRLHAPDGVYSVLGNHDYGDYMDWPDSAAREANNLELKSIQAQMGWTLLNNSHTYIHSEKDSILLLGVENWGEPPFKQYGNLKQTYSFLPDSVIQGKAKQFKILLSHNPEHWRQEVVSTTDIDLTLSGHTHAMQFMLKTNKWKWSPSSWRYAQWGGLYQTTGNTGEPLRIYVNTGCGEVGMPFRIGATPEITLLTLHRQKK